MLPWVFMGGLALLYSAALYTILGKVRQADENFAGRVVAAMCLGPSAAAWVLGVCWRLVPGLSEFATLSILVVVPVFAIVATGVHLRAFPFPNPPQPGPESGPMQFLFYFLLLAGIVYLVLRIPPYSNDPLEYAAVAKLLHDTRSVGIYPVLDSTVSGGLYAPWTHPPGFPLLMALAMLCGDVDAGTALKIVAGLHVILGTAGLAVLVPARMRWVGVLSLTATPAYLLGAINGYVEVVRLTALIGTLGACIALRQSSGLQSAIRLGILFGLGGFVHSLGILSTAFFLPALLLLRSGTPMSRLTWGACIVAVQLLLLAPDLWTNLKNFGVLLGDSPAIWQIPEIGRAEYFREFRSLSGPSDIVFWGLLQGFSQVSNFGISYWLPVALLVATLLAARSGGSPDRRWGARIIGAYASWPPMVRLSAGFVAAFYSLALALTLMGSVEAIKNPRYVLTLQPFVAILTAWLVLGVPHTGLVRRLLVLVLVACSLIPVGYMAERYPGLLTGGQSRQDAYFTHVHPEADAVRAVDGLTTAGDCPLLFKQADYAMYGKHCYRSYLDHRFSDAYRARSVPDAMARLQSQGVATVMTPDYALPEIYNTSVGALLADPAAARLRWARGGYSVYSLQSPRIEPLASSRAGTVAPDAVPGSTFRVDWSVLAGNRPASSAGELVGILCVETAGRGRIEVSTIDALSRPERGPLLRALRGEGRFVLAAAVSSPRRLCVQQPAEQARGNLRVQTTGSARAVKIDFAWAVLHPAADKGN